MTNSLKKLISALTLAAAAMIGSQSALHAVPIHGTVEMQGTIQLNNEVLADATGTVVNATLPEATVNGITSTGSYAGTGGAAVEWKAFNWSPISVLPIASLWEFTSGGRTYSFDLSTLTVLTHDENFLDLRGTGTLRISGSDPTYEDASGLFTFQINSSSGVGANAFFQFQSSNSTPDGGTTALLIGVGLVAMSVAAHRRRLKA